MTDLSQSGFAKAVLQGIGAPVTQNNIAAMVGWENAEGGNWGNNARYNPLNTTLPAAGATSINSAGVKAYTSWSQGVAATVATLKQGNFTGIRAALHAGTPQAVATAIGQSPWGTSPTTVRQTIGAATGQTYNTAPVTLPSSTSTSTSGAYGGLGGFLLKATLTIGLVIAGLVLAGLGARNIVGGGEKQGGGGQLRKAAEEMAAE